MSASTPTPTSVWSEFRSEVIAHWLQSGRSSDIGTPEHIAWYLTMHSTQFSAIERRQQVVAIREFHVSLGSPDPTCSPLVKRTLRTLSGRIVDRPSILGTGVLDSLQVIVRFLDDEARTSLLSGPSNARRLVLLKSARDKALLLTGFWRGLSARELADIACVNVSISPSVGMTIIRGERPAPGQPICMHVPALQRLCPTEAMAAWRALSGIVDGSMFRKLDATGIVGKEAMSATDITDVVQSLITRTGNRLQPSYSFLKHPYRPWFRSQPYQLHELMKVVGWGSPVSEREFLDFVMVAVRREPAAQHSHRDLYWSAK